MTKRAATTGVNIYPIASIHEDDFEVFARNYVADRTHYGWTFVALVSQHQCSEHHVQLVVKISTKAEGVTQ